jgi:hypothetical protein
MSDSFLKLMPTDPKFVPQEEHIKRTIDVLQRILPRAEDISPCLHDAVEFVDPGENFEEVQCPCCKEDLDMEGKVYWS